MTRYEVGFMNKCAEYGLDAGTSVGLMKEAVTAKLLPAGQASFESFLHTPDALLSFDSPLRAYSYDAVHSGVPLKQMFDSHGNFKLNGVAEKAFNMSHTLREGGNITLPQAVRTTGSHHSALALKHRLAKRLERQLYRGEIRDAIWKAERGSKALRLKNVLTNRAARAIRDLAKRF